MESFLSEGRLRHRRFETPAREFSYPLFMMYVDLAELDTVFERRWLWSARRPNVAWLRRGDHHGDPKTPLDAAIRQLVRERTGRAHDGPIRLLTHLRYLGYGMNPVSFFYCFGRDGRTLETIVAEVSNTPWGERHMYVLPLCDRRSDGQFRFQKEFHVSPFMPMDLEYRWRFGAPPVRDGGPLWVNMESWRDGTRIFDATLTLTRKPINGLSLGKALGRHPVMTAEVVVSIYLQALSLWLRRARFHAHPRTQALRGS